MASLIPEQIVLTKEIAKQDRRGLDRSWPARFPLRIDAKPGQALSLSCF